MKNIMNMDKVNSCLDKFRLYSSEEKLILSSIQECLTNLEYDYISKNSDMINELNTNIKKKFDVINKIHDNNAVVLEKSLMNYQTASSKSDMILGDILKGE